MPPEPAVAYLDHAAGGPLDPAAVDAMRPWLAGRFGNPSGTHRVARAARAALDEARDTMADLIGVNPGAVIFTSGGTESDNLAVLGTMAARPGPCVISAVEHPAVVAAAQASGHEVRVAPVDADGVVDLDGLARLLDADVTLVSIQLANHETGVKQPWPALARLVQRRARRAVLHADAVAGAAWLDLPAVTEAAHLVSVSAHKWGGPPGAGVLAARRPMDLRPIIHGGGQERDLRSGTHPVALIAGMAAGARALAAAREDTCARVAGLRDDLARRLAASVLDAVHTAAGADRLPGHLHLRIPGVESEALLVLLDDAGVCASAGAACASGAMEPSPVLLAMGVSKQDALGSLRLTLGPATTGDQIDQAATAIPAAVSRLRGR